MAGETVFYKRSTFVTHLPKDYLFSPSHYWLAPEPDGIWRVGFTKFATRMLGELVDSDWKPKAGEPVEPGQTIGSVEGFKAASDVYCVMKGSFVEGNPYLKEDACVVRSDPYEVGWLYSVKGEPEDEHLDVHGYIAHLSTIIQRMAEEGHGEEGAPED
jgi:glycine cleavage system H protein